MDSIYNIEIEYNNGEKSINQFCLKLKILIELNL